MEKGIGDAPQTKEAKFLSVCFRMYDLGFIFPFCMSARTGNSGRRNVQPAYSNPGDTHIREDAYLAASNCKPEGKYGPGLLGRRGAPKRFA
jgi:hypothetical protein